MKTNRIILGPKSSVFDLSIGTTFQSCEDLEGFFLRNNGYCYYISKGKHYYIKSKLGTEITCKRIGHGPIFKLNSTKDSLKVKPYLISRTGFKSSQVNELKCGDFYYCRNKWYFWKYQIFS